MLTGAVPINSRSVPVVAPAVVEEALVAGAALPKAKAKVWRDHAVLAFFGKPARTQEAEAHRKQKRGRWS
jgi:hypothetical protein